MNSLNTKVCWLYSFFLCWLFPNFILEVTHPWKLQCYYVVLVGYSPACPKFSEATNHRYLWKELCDFVDFLRVVLCNLLHIHWRYKNMLLWAGIARHSLSANQIVRCFRLKKLKKDMRYQVDFLLPLKLEEICYFGLWPQNTLGKSVCRIFCFWLVWLVRRNTGVPLLHCTCFRYFPDSLTTYHMSYCDFVVEKFDWKELLRFASVKLMNVICNFLPWLIGCSKFWLK